MTITTRLRALEGRKTPATCPACAHWPTITLAVPGQPPEHCQRCGTVRQPFTITIDRTPGPHGA